jgi:hypothetical protein
VGPRFAALSLAAGLLVASGFLILQRGGMLAWSGALLALLLAAKVWLRPSTKDLALAVSLLTLWGLAWAAIWQYVKSEWESGEVVVIDIETPSGRHTARVWILELNGEPTMYYDAPPRIAQQLLNGAPVAMRRNGVTVHECADASRVTEVSDEVLTKVFDRMEEKYQERNNATQIFYRMLGGERDRVPILLRLTAC